MAYRDFPSGKSHREILNEKIIESVFEVDTSDPYYHVEYSLLRSAKIIEGYGYCPGMRGGVVVKGSPVRTAVKPQRSVQRQHRGGAYNVNASTALKSKLSQLQKAPHQACKVKTLSDGRIRYYMLEKTATTPGPTRGAYNVVEWNPKTGQVRHWYENCGQDGKPNRVHPKNLNGQGINSPHYPPTGKDLELWKM